MIFSCNFCYLLRDSCPIPRYCNTFYFPFLLFNFNSSLTPTFCKCSHLNLSLVTFLSFVSLFLSAFGRIEIFFLLLLSSNTATELPSLPCRYEFSWTIRNFFLPQLVSTNSFTNQSGISVCFDPLRWSAHSHSILIYIWPNFSVLHTFFCFESEHLRN